MAATRWPSDRNTANIARHAMRPSTISTTWYRPGNVPVARDKPKTEKLKGSNLDRPLDRPTVGSTVVPANESMPRGQDKTKRGGDPPRPNRPPSKFLRHTVSRLPTTILNRHFSRILSLAPFSENCDLIRGPTTREFPSLHSDHRRATYPPCFGGVRASEWMNDCCTRDAIPQRRPCHAPGEQEAHESRNTTERLAMHCDAIPCQCHAMPCNAMR